jgi:hypothetical protein
MTNDYRLTHLELALPPPDGPPSGHSKALYRDAEDSSLRSE